MANLFEHKDRRVIPNWRSFGKTTVLGELSSYQNESLHPIQDYGIDEYVIDFKINRTITYAADLIGAAISNEKRNHEAVIDAANFIISNKELATESQTLLAINIIKNNGHRDYSVVKFDDVTLELLSSFLDTEVIKSKIRDIKNLIRKYPYNPILYVEIARHYSILGQDELAIKSMKTALHLAPDNRYILRCASRLFIHCDDDNGYIEYIHRVLRKSSLVGIDPWITATEISISTLLNRNSKFIKKGINLVNSNNISTFSFTELASSIATVEFLNGSHKKSKDYFSKSLLNPNDNSLAQLEWALSKDKIFDIQLSDYDVKMNFEALALESFNNEDYSTSLDYAAKWFIDMPFSKRPIMFGSNLASIVVKDQKKAILLLEAGLKNNPCDPQLINNLAYSLALENTPKLAFKELEKVKSIHDLDESTQICLTATTGLAHFRDGFLEEGRHFYLDAIERTLRLNDKNLNWIAVLNYAREEILVKSEYVEHIMKEVNKIPDNTNDIEIQSLKTDVIDLYQQLKQEQL